MFTLKIVNFFSSVHIFFWVLFFASSYFLDDLKTYSDFYIELLISFFLALSGILSSLGKQKLDKYFVSDKQRSRNKWYLVLLTFILIVTSIGLVAISVSYFS